MLSLSLRMNYSLQQTLVCELGLIGGVTESIFTSAEKRLSGRTDTQKALFYVARKKQGKRYRSVMDFFFVESFPQWKKSCFLFYRNRGKPFRDILNAREIKLYDRALLIQLRVAEEAFKKQLKISWKMYIDLCHTYLIKHLDLLE